MKITNKDFVGDEYYKLLDILFKEADTFEFSIHEESVVVNFTNVFNKNRVAEAYEEYLEPLEEFLISQIKTNENRVRAFERKHKIHVFKYKAINRSKEILKTFTDHAYGWRMGNIPEYLTFYKNEKAIFAIIEDEAEIVIFKDGEEIIYPLIKNHDNWKNLSD